MVGAPAAVPGGPSMNVAVTGSAKAVASARSNTSASRRAEEEEGVLLIEYWLLEEAKLKRMPPEKELARNAVVVIGAGSGIGKAVAHRIAKEGAHVICADLSEETAKETADELVKIYGVGIGVAGTGISGCGPAIGLAVDITKRETVKSMLENITLAYGGVDNIIITAESFVPPDKQGHIPDDKWALTYGINVTGPYLVADEAKTIWQAQQLRTSLVITTSANGAVAKQGSVAYDTSKAAANHLVRELAIELAPLVRVNGLAPATVVEGSSMFPRDRVISSLTKYNINFNESESTESLRDKLADFYAERTLTKSPITLADQAEIAYLLSSSKFSKLNRSNHQRRWWFTRGIPEIVNQSLQSEHSHLFYVSQQSRLIMAIQAYLHARPKASRGYSTSKILTLGFLFVFLGYFLLPLLWLLIASTKTYDGLFNSFGFWSAEDFSLIQNLTILFTYQNGVFLSWMKNSAIYAVSAAIGSSLVSTMAGYAFARYQFTGRSLLFGIVLASVFVPTSVFAVPLFFLISKTGLSGSLWAVILPASQSVWRLLDAYLLRAGHSAGFDRCSSQDGAGEFRIFATIALRLLVPRFCNCVAFRLCWCLE